MSETYSKIDCPPAIILCGGQSRRMGTNKADLPFGGSTVLQFIIDRFQKFSNSVVVVAGHSTPDPAVEDPSVIIRDNTADCGPMEGLRVGLEHFSRHDLVFVGTCDAPLVIADVYQMMHAALGEFDAVMPNVAGRIHPLTGVYRTRCLDVITRRIQQQQFRVKELIAEIKVNLISESEILRIDPQLNTLKNINTRQDYRDLLNHTAGDS